MTNLNVVTNLTAVTDRWTLIPYCVTPNFQRWPAAAVAAASASAAAAAAAALV